MEAGDAPQGSRRRIINGFIFTMTVLLCTSALPTVHGAQARIRQLLDPLVDVLGLWQGQWQLFAPEADKLNSAVVGIVRYQDGESIEWRSPDWRSLSATQKFRHFRLMEYADGIRRDDNQGAWGALAQYLLDVAVHPRDPDAIPVEVQLWRHWVVIPPPEEPLRPMSEPFRPLERYRFYTRPASP